MSEQVVAEKYNVDSFYLVECDWPEKLEGTTPEDILFQIEEIMSKFRPCYIRHNGLVEVLK